MADVVVTVPMSFGLLNWIDEGDAAGEPWSGEEWDFYLAGYRPNIAPGERVYVVYNGALRGYAPLMRVDTAADSYYVRRRGPTAFSLVRGGGAMAVTIPERIPGFRGWRYRWWNRSIEVPFPDWRDPHACIGWEREPARPAQPEPQPAETVVCARTVRPRHSRPGGSSGSPASAYECPIGLDPRHCDVETRLPALDPRYFRCTACGKVGRFAPAEPTEGTR